MQYHVVSEKRRGHPGHVNAQILAFIFRILMLSVTDSYLRTNTHTEKRKYAFVGFLPNWTRDIGHICCLAKLLPA